MNRFLSLLSRSPRTATPTTTATPPGTSSTMASTAQAITPTPAAATIKPKPKPPNNTDELSEGATMFLNRNPAPNNPNCPTPPNWESSLDLKFQSTIKVTKTQKSPFWKVHLDDSSEEYRVLSQLVQAPTLKILSIDQIVNPELWASFKNIQKEKMCSKSDGFDWMLANGLTLKEVVERRRGRIKRDIKTMAPYSENIVLLFHYSKGKLEDILSQGLDQRLAHIGLLGKGLYFTDDPEKAISYNSADAGNLLVFAVFLGDCLCVDHNHKMASALVREPIKSEEQKRSYGDLFFDSIHGRPGASKANEYVIFNGRQCYPFYVVSYTKIKPITGTSVTEHSICRDFPPFVWTTSLVRKEIQGGTENRKEEWPFFAQAVFDLMKSSRPEGQPFLNILDDVTLKLTHNKENNAEKNTDDKTLENLKLIMDTGLEGFTDPYTIVSTLIRLGVYVEHSANNTSSVNSILAEKTRVNEIKVEDICGENDVEKNGPSIKLSQGHGLVIDPRVSVLDSDRFRVHVDFQLFKSD